MESMPLHHHSHALREAQERNPGPHNRRLPEIPLLSLSKDAGTTVKWVYLFEIGSNPLRYRYLASAAPALSLFLPPTAEDPTIPATA